MRLEDISQLLKAEKSLVLISDRPSAIDQLISFPSLDLTELYGSVLETVKFIEKFVKIPSPQSASEAESLDYAFFLLQIPFWSSLRISLHLN